MWYQSKHAELQTGFYLQTVLTLLDSACRDHKVPRNKESRDALADLYE